ncbi:uncharacterized protein LOC121572251 [Coregonus clupeaformis]|uniref:uncharacterized protein LOC121572251 n=1 Tax=Coregonus clupeaformis TaxID=59861 RepID=UPI001E1C453F|nr:uncharacterized protein LOC121572251 [Coregonus clupeaformis]
MMSHEANIDTHRPKPRPITKKRCLGHNDHNLSTETAQSSMTSQCNALCDVQNECSNHESPPRRRRRSGRYQVPGEDEVETTVNEKNNKKQQDQHRSVQFSKPIAQVPGEDEVETTVNEKNNKKQQDQHRSVHFSKPIAQVQFVSMSEDSREARSSYWWRVAVNTKLLRRRIRQLEPSISRCLDENHRDRMRNYIRVRLESDCH